MSIFSRMKLFQKAAVAIFCFYMGLMIFVTIFAYTRRSGVTGMDMMKIQQMQQNKIHIAEMAEANNKKV